MTSSKPKTKKVLIKRVAILVVGNEVLRGEVKEHNAAYLSRELTALGATVARVEVVPDISAVIVASLKRLRRDHDAVLVTGGIGFTHDDLTRQAVASAFRLPLAVNRAALAVIRRRRRGRPIDPWVRRLAELPSPCRLILNPMGTAPGFIVANVYVFPGVPHMLREMFAGVAEEFRGPRIYSHVIRTMLSESAFAEGLTEIALAEPSADIGSYPLKPGGKFLTRLTVKSADEAAAARSVRRIRKMLARQAAICRTLDTKLPAHDSKSAKPKPTAKAANKIRGR